MKPTDFYRAIHTGNEGDVAFYERVCQGAERILEMGCGWGRISLALAWEGHSVVGIDEQNDFITLARKSAQESADFLQGDVAELDQAWLRRYQGFFDRVLIPYNTLYSLGGEARVLACLRAARACLKPEGELWLDVYCMDQLHEALLGGEEIPEDDEEPILQLEHAGRKVDVFERTTFRPEQQRLLVEYTAKHGQESVSRLDMVHHYLTSPQLVSLLERSQFEVVCRLDGFSSEPDEEGPHIVLGAVAADAIEPVSSAV